MFPQKKIKCAWYKTRRSDTASAAFITFDIRQIARHASKFLWKTWLVHKSLIASTHAVSIIVQCICHFAPRP